MDNDKKWYMFLKEAGKHRYWRWCGHERVLMMVWTWKLFHT